jgi:CheY-like chemotaxis protein
MNCAIHKATNAASGGGVMTRKKCTVLLVENNPDDARLVEIAFERAELKHCLIVLEDGLQALDYIKGRAPYADREKYPLPSLILLDLGLPGLSGLELLQQLRLQPKTKDVPITVLSGSNFLRDVTKAYQLGANSFLVKPSDLKKFTAAVKETVDFWLGTTRFPRTPVYLQMPAVPASGEQIKE